MLGEYFRAKQKNGNSEMYSLYAALTIVSLSSRTPLYHINNIGN